MNHGAAHWTQIDLAYALRTMLLAGFFAGWVGFGFTLGG